MSSNRNTLYILHVHLHTSCVLQYIAYEPCLNRKDRKHPVCPDQVRRPFPPLHLVQRGRVPARLRGLPSGAVQPLRLRALRGQAVPLGALPEGAAQVRAQLHAQGGAILLPARPDGGGRHRVRPWGRRQEGLRGRGLPPGRVRRAAGQHGAGGQVQGLRRGRVRVRDLGGNPGREGEGGRGL